MGAIGKRTRAIAGGFISTPIHGPDPAMKSYGTAHIVHAGDGEDHAGALQADASRCGIEALPQDGAPASGSFTLSLKQTSAPEFEGRRVGPIGPKIRGIGAGRLTCGNRKWKKAPGRKHAYSGIPPIRAPLTASYI